MIRLSRGFQSKWTGTSLRLSTHVFKRVQFGISAFILLAGLVAALIHDALDTSNWGGVVFFFFLLGVTLWMAGFSKTIVFTPKDRSAFIMRTFFGLPLGVPKQLSLGSGAEVQVISVGLFPTGKKPEGEDYASVQTRSRSKSLSKLLIHTGEKQVYIDESSYQDEVEAMAMEISKVMGIPLSRS